MSRKNKGVATGIVLVLLGVLFEFAAISEQPDRLQLSPNRFYTAEDLHEFHVALSTLRHLQMGKDLAIANVRSGDEQQAPRVNNHDDLKISERGAIVAAADAEYAALKQKQDTAFRNQECVSQTIKWTGIIILAGVVILLLSVRTAKRAALSNAPSDKMPTS